jgi:hypothetical protein
MDLVLNSGEMVSLYKQDPKKKGDGGWQSLLVSLQESCDRPTGAISITLEQRRRIRRYAFKYKNGGWESRLKATFSRHLGPKLDLGLPPPEWLAP